MTKDLRGRLQGNVEENPGYSSSSTFHRRRDQQNSVGVEGNSPGASAVLKNSLEEDDRCATKSTAAANDDNCHARKYKDMDEHRSYIVDSIDTQLSGTKTEREFMADLMIDHETPCNIQVSKEEETKSDEKEAVDKMKSDNSETIETLELNNLSADGDGDGDDTKFDSFDDILNYEKKYEDKKYLDNFVLDGIMNINGHGQSDNDFVMDDALFSSLQKPISAENDFVTDMNDVPFEEHRNHLSLEEDSYIGGSANKVNEEQSSSRHHLQNFTQEWTGDVGTNKVEKLITSDTLTGSLPSKTEDSIDSGKISEWIDNSSLPAMELLKDSSVHKEDIVNKASVDDGDKDDISSHR